MDRVLADSSDRTRDTVSTTTTMETSEVSQNCTEDSDSLSQTAQVSTCRCKTCGRSCPGLASLKMHERVHTGERPFECNYCGKRFSQLGNLQRHMRSHMGRKPFTCGHCGKCFSTARSLHKHKLKHTVCVEEKHIQPNQSKDTISTTSTMETTNAAQNCQTDNYKKLLRCSTCGKAFGNKSNLENHERVHTGEKPFKCSYCEKCFSQAGNLQRHERTHTGEKPFKCAQCGKCYSEARNLRVHKIDKHTGGKRVRFYNKSKNVLAAMPSTATETTKETENCTKDTTCDGKTTSNRLSGKIFRCSTCGRKCIGKGNLRIHERVHTGEKPFKCRYCDKWLSQRGNLQRHERSHTGEKPFKCEQCKKCFSDARHLRKHKVKHTEEKRIQCQQSPNTIVIPVSVQGCTETGTLDGERRRYPVKKTLNCRYCSKRFRNTSNRKQHERVHTGEKPFRCKHCDKSFCQLGNMQRHERAHTGEKPYKCEECARCFSDVRSLRNHVKVHKQEQPCRSEGVTVITVNLQIPIATLTNVDNLGSEEKHDQITDGQSGKKCFKCKYCDKVFGNTGTLKNHERIHTGEKPFKCSYCEKCFNQAGNLQRHERTHSEEKAFKCEQCGKCFCEARNLRIHEFKKHKPEKLFNCDQEREGAEMQRKDTYSIKKDAKCKYCDKVFCNLGALKSHERVHTGEKPSSPVRKGTGRTKRFKCKYCVKAFPSTATLKSHERVHTGEKPFKCSYCEKCFSQLGNLQRHERTHAGEKPFKCQHCGKCYSDKRSFRKHESSHTGEYLFSCDQERGYTEEHPSVEKECIDDEEQTSFSICELLDHIKDIQEEQPL